MDITIAMVIYALVAAAVSLAVRFFDYPVSELVLVDVVKTFIGALIAVGFSMWMLISSGTDLYILESFAIVAGAGVGGMAFVRGILEMYKKVAA